MEFQWLYTSSLEELSHSLRVGIGSKIYIYRNSSKRRHGYYLFQLYRNVATIRGRLLFISALPQCGDYSKYRRRGYYLFQLYRNAATIRSTDVAAIIYFSATAMRRLSEGGYYSKYRRCGYYLFQLYRNAVTI